VEVELRIFREWEEEFEEFAKFKSGENQRRVLWKRSA
jgi:hypothetical protein